MSHLLKKKNYNTTKGTKRWRKNLDATELEDKIVVSHQKKYEEEQAQAKLEKNEKITFSIDTTGDKKIKAALEKDRFHKKIDESNISEIEMKKYKQLARKMKQEEASGKPAPKKVEKIEVEDENAVDDCWGEEKETKPLIAKKQKIAHVIIPTSGMSYNPSYKDHQEIIEDAIRLEDDDLKERNLTKVKKLRKKKKDLKEYERIQRIKRDLAMNPVQKQKKEERAIAHSAHLIKQYKKEIKKDEEDNQKNLERIQKQKESENQIKEKLGFNFKPEKLGMKRYTQKGQDFVLEEDLPDNLRTIQSSGSLLRDEYESVFRKGLLEPKNYFKKDKKSKIPAIRFRQKFDPYFQSEWDEVDTALDVKQ